MTMFLAAAGYGDDLIDRSPARQIMDCFYFRMPTVGASRVSFVALKVAALSGGRVVSWKKEGETGVRGEGIGRVRFGLRVDVWVPKEAEILVKVGENVKGGSSVMGRWPAKPAAAKLDGLSKAETDANLT